MPDGREEERQNQCIAFGDGRDYVKYENNPVVTGEMLPENCSRIDFRDPKIWKEEDTYYLIVGSKDNRQIGQVVLCSSKDLKEWKFETVLAANSTGKVGTMWECPDFFPLGDKHVLICSPQNMKAEKYEFHNGNNSVYFLGNYDKNSHIFEKEEPHTIDYGLDFYAPQTTLLPDGRRVMIAWMKSWDACVVPDTQDWQGMMTLPRELEVKDGQIWQQPVRELAQYHKNPCHYEHAEIDGETALSGICGRTMDLTITMDEQDFNVFSIQLAADEEYETKKGTDLVPLFETIVNYIDPPTGDENGNLQLLVSSIDYNEFVGRIGIGRIERGKVRQNQEVIVCDYHDPSMKEKAKIVALYEYTGLGRSPIQEAAAGEIVAFSGISDITIGRTLCVADEVQPLPFVKISDPTIEMTFSINDSPFAGREGKYVTSRNLRDRLQRELLKDVSLHPTLSGIMNDL